MAETCLQTISITIEYDTQKFGTIKTTFKENNVWIDGVGVEIKTVWWIAYKKILEIVTKQFKVVSKKRVQKWENKLEFLLHQNYLRTIMPYTDAIQHFCLKLCV